MTRTSSDDEDESLDRDFTDVVPVTESVNCLGVSDPVLDRVTILRASAINEHHLISYFNSKANQKFEQGR